MVVRGCSEFCVVERPFWVIARTHQVARIKVWSGRRLTMLCRQSVVFVLVLCGLLSNPASAQRSAPGSPALAGVNTTALVACIRHDISKKSAAATIDTSPLSLATAVQRTCRSQMQDLERAFRKAQAGSFDQMAFEREWRAAIAVGVQEALTGTPVNALDLESGLRNGQASKEFTRILRANVEAKRVAAQACLFLNIHKNAATGQGAPEDVALTAIGEGQQELRPMNHTNFLHDPRHNL